MSDAVTVWLKQLGLDQYAEAFSDNAIDEEVLPDLTDMDLREIGLPLGHRKKVLKAIGILAAEDTTTVLPTSASDSTTTKYQLATTGAERRHLSVMFCDLAGSTTLSERLDLETYRDLLGSYQDAARKSIERYGGYIARYLGDGLLVYFGYPTAHEDDAESAVRAGLKVVEAVSRISLPGDIELRVRVGIATGQVVAGDIIGKGASEEHAVLGETPNLAARLQGLAAPNSVVISEATQRLVKGRFEVISLKPQLVKGLREPVHAFQAKAVLRSNRFEAATSLGLSTFVGRQGEFQLLLERWSQAKEGEGQVVLLSGEAGIGKSRLLRELRDRVNEEPHAELRYQCSPYAMKTAFSPIIEQLQHSAAFAHVDTASEKLNKLEGLLENTVGALSETAPLLAALLSLPNDRYPPLAMTPQRQKLQTIAVLVAQLEGLARQQPVLVLVEDIHWSDPSTLEAFEAAIERTQTIPVLIVMTHRPEFESAWVRFGHVTHHSLNRLKRSDGKELSEQATGGRALPDAVLAQILARTDGIPLFIEEVTKTVLEGGVLREENGRYVLDGPLTRLGIPETVQDSLMARLDRLGPAKEAAQAAACIGREFTNPLLEKVLERTSIEGDLKQLLDAGLIFRRGAGESESYVFKHALVQDAAYESLLVTRRQQLHSRIANAIEGSPDTDPGVLARHFSAAGIAEKSATCFLAAGRRALSVWALPEAFNELEMGLREISTLSTSSELDRLELDLRKALGAARIAYRGWPHSSVADAYEPAFELAEKLDDQQDLGPILWGLCVHYWTRAEFPETHLWLTRLEDRADRAKDSELSVVRDMTAGCQYFWEAEYEKASQYTAHIRETYDESRHASVTAYTNHDPLTFSLHWAGSLLQWIIGYPDRGLEMVNEAHDLARRVNHPFNSAFALTAGSECLLMRGDSEHVLRCCDEVQKIVDEAALGDFVQHVLVDNWRGRAHTQMGEFETGYRLTKLATTRWLEAEGKICRALFWCGEAIALGGLDRTQEALNLIEAAIVHCRSTGDRFMEPETLRVKAELMLTVDGSDSTEVERILTEAIQIARDHRAKSLELRAATSLAKLWRTQDKLTSGRDLVAPLYDWFTEGFDTMDLKEAKALLEE